MKLNRWLPASLAVLALGCSLAAPAFAAEPSPTPEEVQALNQKYGLALPDAGWSTTGEDGDYAAFLARFTADYMAAHPEEYAAFNADGWFAQEWEWWTREEYMKTFGVTEEGFRDAMWKEYVQSLASPAYDAKLVADYRAAHPGELERYDVKSWLSSQGYRDPMEAAMEDYGFSTAQEMTTYVLARYVQGRQVVSELLAQAQSYAAADPAGYAAFDADAYYADVYGEWYPKEEYLTDNFLISQEEFAASVYVESVSMQNEEPGYPSWRPDQPVLVINGEMRKDVALTAENGVTYASAEQLNGILGTEETGDRLPVRSTAAARGWDVVWNSGSNQVILLDRTEIRTQLDKELADFNTLMERLLAISLPQNGQSYRTTENCSLALTAFNSLDGDQTYNASLRTDTLVRDNQLDLTLSMSAADLLNLLSQQTLDQLSAEVPKFTAQNLKSLLTGCKVQMLFDLETGKLYANAPILAAFDETVSENTWFAWDLGGGMDFSALTENTGNWGTELLYNILLDQSESGYLGGEYAYDSFKESRTIMALLFGPERFTEQNGTLTWNLNAETLNSLLGQTLGEIVEAPFKEFGLSVSVSETGRFSTQAVLRPDMDAAAALVSDSTGLRSSAAGTAAMTWVMNLFDFRMASQASGTADKAVEAAEFHWKNQFKLTMSGTAARKATTDLPRSAPPAGAEVIEL
ncbi:MAG: hypothetical protein VB096_07840 [Pseudoflavonifractor sp.]|nr:hypothetical protein [Pseudoflavonifractor sp.]